MTEDRTNVFVIPDIHLKPWIFEGAAKIMKEHGLVQAVCLMDIADDWGQQRNIPLYKKTYEAAISFAEQFPDTLWCLGNHDVSYLWKKRESGYSDYAADTVCQMINRLSYALRDPKQMAVIHRIGNVLFSHAGLSAAYVLQYLDDLDPGTDPDPKKYDSALERINGFGAEELWQDNSPLWLRPQIDHDRMAWPETFLQVVGHTPVKRIHRQDNVISCDVFSSDPNGFPLGLQSFLLLDTKTWEYRTIL